MLYSFTYFLPRPDNINKAKSTFYFRLIILFTIAAFESIFLYYEGYPLLSLVLNSLFILIITYNLLFAVYSRYDQAITRKHYLFFVLHCLVFIASLIFINLYIEQGYFRSIFVLINIALPYAVALKKCNQQFKAHRIGDRVLISSLLIIILLLLLYIFIYTVFFDGQKQIPLTLYFIAMLGSICVLFFGFALSIIYSLVGKLRKEIITDKLTGVKNRNYLNEVAKQLFSASIRNKTEITLILCDIDNFKEINDTYGHIKGDKVLIEFSRLIEGSLRIEDVFIRIGGEEFIILLPEQSIEQAQVTAERLRVLINEALIDLDTSNVQISASFGVTKVDPKLDIDKNIHLADIALYEAKRSGRNKVVTYSA